MIDQIWEFRGHDIELSSGDMILNCRTNRASAEEAPPHDWRVSLSPRGLQNARADPRAHC